MREEKYTMQSIYTEESPHGKSIYKVVYTKKSIYKEVYIQKKYK